MTREAAIRLLEETKTYQLKTMCEAIDMAIEALSADTEQVVRCKYCKYYEGNDVGWCPKLEKGIFEDFFCALGEEDKHE